MVLQHYIMFEAMSGSKAVVSFFSPTSITQGGTSQGQITSRHLKALQLSPEIVTALSRLNQAELSFPMTPLLPSLGMSSMFTCLPLFSTR